MKIDILDGRFEVFSGFGPGGANRNKCQKCIRATHIPTGIKATATKERSLTQNKKAALEALQEKIDKAIKNQKDLALKEIHDNKADASFGSQIRTYKLVGNDQKVIDHRSGVVGNIRDVLEKGDIDIFFHKEIEYA
jgi:protein subunit release factor A